MGRRQTSRRRTRIVSDQRRTPDDEAIEIYASLRVDSERRGHALGQKVHEADRWVATAALRLRLPLLSDDSIFRDVPGLLVMTSAAG